LGCGAAGMEQEDIVAKVVATGFLICLISLYFMLLASENNGSTGLGGLTFWLGVIVVLIGLLNKEE